ncbi:hypothetical protein [Streptomyces sp. DH10]|uniref:hypothetical protein n=1 Tax=Streptomyces sp. DH10 TaxID=3040121 RepID=UPI0024422A1F|nr:hypothetical protein [Streptomyces sp. DH10]MDG9708293.1 hypothetical protein [Streptomyces sp. DH10]
MIEDGRLAEEGTHGELMEHDGIYAYLFNLQAAGYRAEDGPDGTGDEERQDREEAALR